MSLLGFQLGVLTENVAMVLIKVLALLDPGPCWAHSRGFICLALLGPGLCWALAFVGPCLALGPVGAIHLLGPVGAIHLLGPVGPSLRMGPQVGSK